jgi:hypothetical protein
MKWEEQLYKFLLFCGYKIIITPSTFRNAEGQDIQKDFQFLCVGVKYGLVVWGVYEKMLREILRPKKDKVQWIKPIKGVSVQRAKENIWNQIRMQRREAGEVA